MFLLLALVQVIEAAIDRLIGGRAPVVHAGSFGVMLATLLINLWVVRYESKAGRRLKSEVLIADAHHTRSDVLTSLAVIAALAGSAFGWPVLDPLAALVIALFIGYAGYQIAKETSAVLADEAVLDPAEVSRIVREQPEVLGCHQIRTRGSSDHAFLDLHVWYPASMPLAEAHRLSHIVKARLLAAFPMLADVIIHIEPPGED